jgi:hypothetical protein
VQAPELNWDDFRGMDVKGKTIVVLVNDPPIKKADGTLDEKVFGGKAMTYYGRWTYKYEKAAELGAAGVIIVHETEPGGLSVQRRPEQQQRAIQSRDARQEHGPRLDRRMDLVRGRHRAVQDGWAGLSETQGIGRDARLQTGSLGLTASVT